MCLKDRKRRMCGKKWDPVLSLVCSCIGAKFRQGLNEVIKSCMCFFSGISCIQYIFHALQGWRQCSLWWSVLLLFSFDSIYYYYLCPQSSFSAELLLLFNLFPFSVFFLPGWVSSNFPSLFSSHPPSPDQHTKHRKFVEPHRPNIAVVETYCVEVY